MGDPPLIASAPTVATSRAAASNPNIDRRLIDRRDLTGRVGDPLECVDQAGRRRRQGPSLESLLETLFEIVAHRARLRFVLGEGAAEPLERPMEA